MLLAIGQLVGHFGRRLVRNMFRGPDLAMRMRIACAHHGAAIFKNLHMLDFWPLAQLLVLGSPRIHHAQDIRHVHTRKRQAVVGMETQHTAKPAFAFRPEQKGCPSPEPHPVHRAARLGISHWQRQIHS